MRGHCNAGCGGILLPMAKKTKRKENEFDKLARLIKHEGEDIRTHMATKDAMRALERKMDEGFAAVVRRLDEIIQMSRIKKLETAVFK